MNAIKATAALFLILSVTYTNIKCEEKVTVSPAVYNITGCHVIPSGCEENETMQCDTLEHALHGIQDNEWDFNVTVKIPPGQHDLQNSYTFANKTKIHFQGGKNSKDSVVKCNSVRSAGIAFKGSSDISISDISFVHCGALQYGISRNWTDSTKVIAFHAALFFLNCEDVDITDVQVLNSIGTGLAMFNTGGYVTIRNSTFKNSVPHYDNEIGGSGIHIELIQNSTSTGNECENTVSNSTYQISDCNFTENNASSGEYRISHVTVANKIQVNYFSFGMGGGMAIHIGSNAKNNTIFANSCTFSQNSANQGGGLAIFLLQNSIGNNVTVNGSRFISNKCTTQELPPAYYSYGGGMAVYLKDNTFENTVAILSTIFDGNTAYYGGGLSLHSGIVSDTYSTSDSNSFTLGNSCVFQNNSARIGGAVDLFCPNSFQSESKCVVDPTITKVEFINNTGKYFYKQGDIGKTFSTLNIQYLPTKFRGTVQFINNRASGLGLQETTVEVAENSIVSFINNTGKLGGGMVLIGRSTVLLNDHCTINFNGNFALEKGGAIYASQTQERYAAYDYNCFFKHASDLDSYIHPNTWDNVKITFVNNTVTHKKTKNAIYLSSLLPCVWPSNVTSGTESDIEDTFCNWNSWNFIDPDKKCRDQINTLPAKFKNKTSSTIIRLYSGQTVHLANELKVIDDFGHDVTNQSYFTGSFEHQSDRDINNELELDITTSGKLKICGSTHQDRVVNITLQTVDERSISTTVSVQMLKCPPGTYIKDPKSSSAKCECLKAGFRENLICNKVKENFVALIFIGHCVSYWNNTNELVAARCSYLAGNICPNNRSSIMRSYYQLPNTANQSDFNLKFCAPTNRDGKLCERCRSGYGIDIFSSNYRCMNCTKGKRKLWTHWAEVSALITIPITIFFVIITVFHIGVTSAYTNGFIFFSHMISIRLNILIVESAWNVVFKHNAHKKGEILTKTLFTLYHMWSLEFPQMIVPNIHVCLNETFKVMHILALQYVSAFYALLLVFITYILIELHARNYRPLVCLWKPMCFLCVRFRRNWEMRTSVIDAFATVILLSYGKLVGTSISLLAPNSVYFANGTQVELSLHYDTSVQFFSNEHKPYAALAIAILILFGAIPPFLLFFYPFKWFQKVLNFCHLNRHGLSVFMDAFQGIYKNGADKGTERRYFAAVYFIYRIFINILYNVPFDLTALYASLTVAYVILLVIVILLRPYKNNFYNNLDTCFITILAIKSVTILYCIVHAVQFGTLPYVAWIPAYSLCYIPILYMIGFCFYWICANSRFVQTYCIPRCVRMRDRIQRFKNHQEYLSSIRILASPAEETLVNTNEFDRLENPDRYARQYANNRYSLLQSEDDQEGDASNRIGQQSRRRGTVYGSVTY